MDEDNQERTHCTISAEEFSALCDDVQTGLGELLDEVEYLKGIRWRLRQFYWLDPSVPKEDEPLVVAYMKEIALLLISPPDDRRP
jgi:hypothetical protein